MTRTGLRNAVVLSAMVLAGGLTVAPASSAQAPASTPAPASDSSASVLGCGHSHSNKDGGSGYGTDSDGSINIRTGPHDYCTTVDIVPNNRKLLWHCWTKNESGNKWTHLRVAGTTTNGWVWDGNLTGGGSDGAADRC